MHESSPSTIVLKRDYSGVELNRCIDHSGHALRPKQFHRTLMDP